MYYRFSDNATAVTTQVIPIYTTAMWVGMSIGVSKFGFFELIDAYKERVYVTLIQGTGDLEIREDVRLSNTDRANWTGYIRFDAPTNYTWPVGTKVELRLTSAQLNHMQQVPYDLAALPYTLGYSDVACELYIRTIGDGNLYIPNTSLTGVTSFTRQSRTTLVNATSEPVAVGYTTASNNVKLHSRLGDGARTIAPYGVAVLRVQPDYSMLISGDIS